MNQQPVYLTTTLPYVNGSPHVGHCVEFIRADIWARHQRQSGRTMFFNCGTDEHGQKVAEKSQQLGVDTQAYVDEMSHKWQEFCNTIGMSYDYFSRTTSPGHIYTAQQLWRRCHDNGYIYKKHYQSKYCVGCELEKTDSELVDGVCPDHPNRPLETIAEENYFFAFSKFQQRLLDMYRDHPTCVVPDFRLQEITQFVSGGLQDFSISRLRKKMSWGVPVPNDDEHVMYVWFDALGSYISCLGWPDDAESMYQTFWQQGTTVQFCGKDNLRQQAAIWQSMLMAADLPATGTIFCEGHIISGGMKMSKSLGNVVDPLAYIAYYGIDAVRYFVARGVHNVQDSDWTAERFHESYTAHLVNGLGNLVNRVLTMSDNYGVQLQAIPQVEPTDLLDSFDFNAQYDMVWQMIADADQFITTEEPFKKAKTDMSAAQEDVRYLLDALWRINESIAPLMPDTYKKIGDAIGTNTKPSEPLFPRLEYNAQI